MMMLWAWAGLPLGVYNIVENFNVALRIQPQILTLLSLATWIQCYYYQRVRRLSTSHLEHWLSRCSHQRWTLMRSLLVVIPIAITMGAIQAALIIGLRILKSQQVEWPLTLMAVLSAALLAAGVLRHYWDIWIHRTVRGISFIFVGIDAAGDLFSLVSIFFQPSLDVLGMVIYGTELALWCGVFACGGYYNFLPWFREKWPELDQNADRAGETTITLHDHQSSTSVFRTASRGSTGVRPRTVVSPQRSGDALDDPSVQSIT